MSFTINFNYNGIEEAKEVSDLVEEKLQTIEKYLHDKDAISCDVVFSKLVSHQSGKLCYIEANLQVNGTLYHAEATEESFEKSADKIKDELTKELRRAKSKQETLTKQGGRKAKEKMLGLK